MSVALWVNGGPGASSIAYGFWTEHGPFRLADNGTRAEPYPHSWNRHASMVYFEAPTGVGFSHSANKTRYATNTDAQASLDNYYALLNFFAVFERFDRMIADADARRNAIFHEIERHRAAFARRMRDAVAEVEDAEFEDVVAGEAAE